MRASTSGLLLFALAAAPAAPQVEVTNLARDFEILTATDDLRCTLFASFEETGVEVGMELLPGDLVASVSGATDLELTCPNGSLLRFSGSFRVLINPPDEAVDCAVNFLAGTLDVLTDQPTEVNAGGVVLGTEGTQYSVEVARGDAGAEETCSVWDGRVRWRAKDVERQWLDGGKRLEWSRSRFSEAAIPEAHLSRAAERQARFDAVKALRLGATDDPRAAAERLARLHQQVLAQPGDVERRVELAKAQIDYRISGQATYHLGRAGIRTDEEMRRHQIDVDRLRATRASAPTLGSVKAVQAADPFALIEQERFQEALEILEPKVAAGDADARELCAVARGYFRLDRVKSRRAAAAAERALSANVRDRHIPADELRLCKRLAS